MHQYGSLGVPKTPKSHDALIEVGIQIHKNKLHFCTYIESETQKIFFDLCEPLSVCAVSIQNFEIRECQIVIDYVEAIGIHGLRKSCACYQKMYFYLPSLA